ncbi:kinase-like protein [Gigaspora margarita]|uniref:Kinase-like protein n=1 Tax=Gigaspora margarita TaxID=4874 RepID=A0A8H4ALD8_GIGMA|nr:kinase-like protein [Gigaspora margarita]
MTKTPGEWLEKAISDGHINYLEYKKFTDPTEIGSGVDTSIDEKAIKDFINELKLLRKVYYHPNIITFYGITKDSSGYYNIVLQYADDRTLREYLKMNFTQLQWTDKLRIAKEIAFGLLFLHNNNIIHKDLHSKNNLIHQKQPKIADFGLSKQINEISMTPNSIVHGIPAYIEPKYFNDHKYKRDNKSDVYSFGVILWEILSGRPPFQSFESIYALTIHIFKGNREKPIEGTPP